MMQTQNFKAPMYHTNYNTFKNTGYSTFGSNLSATKSISQIKRENANNKQSNYNFIDKMYKTGKFFQYNLKPPHLGSHRSHLGYLEDCARSMLPNLGNQKNQYYLFSNECDILRDNLRKDYKDLKYELNEEINNVQIKFNLEMNNQKVVNAKANKEMKELKNEILETKNLAVELKMRINSLKLRIDGNGMFNQDGQPVLDTHIN